MPLRWEQTIGRTPPSSKAEKAAQFSESSPNPGLQMAGAVWTGWSNIQVVHNRRIVTDPTVNFLLFVSIIYHARVSMYQFLKKKIGSYNYRTSVQSNLGGDVCFSCTCSRSFGNYPINTPPLGFINAQIPLFILRLEPASLASLASARLWTAWK